MAQLPNVGTEWENFTILLPGTSRTPSGEAIGSTASIPGQFVNGNLSYNAMLADGSVTTLPSSSNSDVSTFETVAELSVEHVELRRSVRHRRLYLQPDSKGGTDQFHGAVHEYFQNDSLNAKDYGFGAPVTVPFLRYNNYGGSISGPILKKKMFFYFNFEGSAIVVPTLGSFLSTSRTSRRYPSPGEALDHRKTRPFGLPCTCPPLR